MRQTLYDKIWDDHVVDDAAGRHLPALYRPPSRPRSDEPAGLRGPARRRPHGARAGEDAGGRRPQRADHRPHARASTIRESRHPGRDSRRERPRCSASNIYDALDRRQGIVHIIGPEQGFTLPGTTIVCGDSHTSTHGAFGALAHGIGTSEVEHVLATQTLIQRKAKNMRVKRRRHAAAGVTAKDIILAIIGEIGTAGGTGHVIEYAGEAIRALSMEGRMTVCNMSIEGGARAGMIAPDETTFAYLKGRPKAPKGAAVGSGAGATGRRCAPTRARISTATSGSTPRTLPPIVTWGTQPAGRGLDRGPRAGPGRDRATRASAPRSSGRWPIWA